MPEEVELVLHTRGATVVRHLHRLGVLGRDFLAIHAVWFSVTVLDEAPILEAAQERAARLGPQPPPWLRWPPPASDRQDA
ncbi:MAG: hypothetical protein ACYDEN_01795 [Acidimicrobiales bacterium]